MTSDTLRAVHALRRRLSLLNWIALLAMAALALLPTVSHALAWAQGSSPYVEICTPQGARLVALNADGSVDEGGPAAGSAIAHLQHCPLCSLTLDAPALPPAAVSMALPIASAEPPALYLQAPYTLHAWRSAQPRGPPALS